jgi:hypothetical protein
MIRPKHDAPNVIPFRPRPKPPRVPSRWERSLKLFVMLLAVVGVLRGLYAGIGFGWYDLLFVVLLAGAITLGDYLAKRG